MPKSLLLEAGFAALPADLFGSRVPEFKELVSQILTQEKFEFSRVKTWVNANRLAVMVEGLSETQTSCIKEIRGPKASAAYDLNNLPTPAATGFAAAQGLEMKDLLLREVDGEKFLFARKMTAGQALEKCLARLCTSIFSAFPFSFASWSERSPFPQPLLNLCAMLDDKVIDLEMNGIKAGCQVISFNGLNLNLIRLESANTYPTVMKELGLMNEFAEKRKNFDARIRSILPEGFLVRDPVGFINESCLFYENAEPLLVKFDKKYLEMPEVIIAKLVSGYFGYLICEDAHGRILPSAVAMPKSSVRLSDEAEIRSGILNQQLDKIWTIWNRDVHSLPGRIEKLAEQVSDLGQLKKELFCDCSLPGIADGICEMLDCPADTQKKVAALISLIEEGEKTEIGRLLQGTGFSVMFNRLKGVEAFKPYIEELKEVCHFFEDRIPVTETESATIVCLTILLQGHVNAVRCFNCSPERILNFIFCAELKLDLFAVFSSIFAGVRIERKVWIDTALRLASRENQMQLPLEALASAHEFDPASFNEAYREWKNHEVSEFEDCMNLLSRIRNKLSGIERTLHVVPESELENELSNRLAGLEKLPGVDYLAIFNFFAAEKVNVEACLMNLPAVLDDTSEEFSARISLLQRLQRQLARLPFIKKEKKTEKS